jgi:hypothetical protein
MPASSLLRTAIALSAAATIGLSGSAFAQDEQTSATPGAEVASTHPPVDFHEGTCTDVVLEPWYDTGNLTERPYNEVADQMREDLMIENPPADLDRNGNGVIDDDEIFGETAGGTATDTVWYLDTGVDSDFEGLFDNQNVLAVHLSPRDYEQIIACGEVGGAQYDERDRVIIPLNAVEGSGYSGFAVFGNDFSDLQTGIRVYLFVDDASTIPAAEATPAMATPENGTPTGG